MPSERLLAIFALMDRQNTSGPGAVSLCAVAAQFTGVDGAHIALSHNPGSLTAYCATDELASSLLDLEITLGEGPATEVCASNEAVLVANLALEPSDRWVSYPALAATSHVAALFSFPIHVGAVRLGALTLFRRAPGSLDLDQESDAFLVATVVARAILTSDPNIPAGNLLDSGDASSHFDFVIHQAAGMIAVQGAFGIADALVALRAHAFASSESLSALCTRVVARRVLYDASSHQWVEMTDDDGADSE